MKKTIRQTKLAKFLAMFIAALLLCVAYTTKAALIVYEGFEYNANETLLGKAGGFGWLTNVAGQAGGWETNSTALSNAVIRSGSLTYTDPLGNSLLTSSNKLHLTGDGSVTGENIGGSTANGAPRRYINYTNWPGNVSPGSNYLVLTNPGTVQTTWISYLTARTGVAQATNVTTNVGGVNFGHGTNFYNRACAAG
ncbi:MAG: hypothetical protein RLZZ350_1230, partial [Verrucomicrobiota bacterium]